MARSFWLYSLEQVPLFRRLAPFARKLGSSFLDTGLASAQNLLSVVLIGAAFDIETLGQFSILLIYSSFVFLIIYNFLVVPATSREWPGPGTGFASIASRVGLIVTVFATIIAALLDHYFLGFVKSDRLVSFTFVAAYSAFLGLRRIALHYDGFVLPSASPLILLCAFGLVSIFAKIGYAALLSAWSLSLILPFMGTLTGSMLRQPAPHFHLARQFFAFSRWMAIGIWFQWLSGNLVQILVQQELGDAGLGQLRILLSSFGFMSIYFQHREIGLARTLVGRSAAQSVKSFRDFVANYSVPALLLSSCLPLYFGYCVLIGTPFLPSVATIYAIYQFLLLLTVEQRVRLRVMGDMSFTSAGYLGMVGIILLVAVTLPTFTLTVAAWLYLISITLMVVILWFGERIVRSRRERENAA